MSDDVVEVVELEAPLPGLARSATVTYRASGGGEVVVVGPDGDSTTTRLDADGLRAWVDDARAFQARVAARREANAADAAADAELAATRAERSASIRPACPYCGVPREHRGRKDLAFVHDTESVDWTRQTSWLPSTVAMELYACPRCGSAEWFTAGELDHPLGD